MNCRAMLKSNYILKKRCVPHSLSIYTLINSLVTLQTTGIYLYKHSCLYWLVITPRVEYYISPSYHAIVVFTNLYLYLYYYRRLLTPIILMKKNYLMEGVYSR
jgi:hypothetical protein